RDLARATALVLERARALGLALEANLALLVRAVARRAKGALARPSEVAKAACALLEAAAEHGVAAARALMEVLPQEDGEVSALKLELALRAVAVSARGRKDGLVLARQAALAAADEDPGAGATVVLERASEALSLPGKEGEPA
ncbi:hypothetical protein HY251_14800, partial [bacterium]|nr:hypothetical protein [bacterium]